MARKNSFLKKVGDSLSAATNDIFGDEFDDIKGKVAEVTKDFKEKVEDTGIIDAFNDVTGRNNWEEEERLPGAMEQPEFIDPIDLDDDVPDAVFVSASATVKESQPAQQVEDSQFDIYSKQIEHVKKLKELMDLGIISEEEFEAKKKEVLGL